MFWRYNLPASNKFNCPAGLALALLLAGQLLLSVSFSPPVRAANPAIKFEKESGETGSPLVIHASGYAPDKLVALEIIQPNKPDTYPPELIYRLGLVLTSGKGEFTWQGVVPASFVTVDYVHPEIPPQNNPYNGPINIEAKVYTFETNVEEGAQLKNAVPEQKASATFTVTANHGKGPKLYNTNGSLDSDTFLTQLWNPLDLPVANQKAKPNRGYNWGPRPFYATYELYVEGSANGYRPVIYWDKSRMENTAGKEEPYLTNGLLVVEMVSGRMQMGDTSFIEANPSNVFVAGDLANNVGPVYSAFKPLLSVNDNQDGARVNHQLTPEGKVQPNPAYDQYNVTAGHKVNETGHFIASVFWDYLSTKGTVATLTGLPPSYSYNKVDSLYNPAFFATGYPIAEPVWAEVTVAGQTRPVLIQLFERRVLTYTPSNPEAYRVEMGNVGLQYWAWRYSGEATKKTA